MGALYVKRDRLRNIAAIQNAGGCIELFGTAPDDTIWHTRQTQPNNGWMGQWEAPFSPGARLRSIVAMPNADRRIELFATAPDNTIWHI